MRSYIVVFIAALALAVNVMALAQPVSKAAPLRDFQVIETLAPAPATEPDSGMVLVMEGWGEQFQLVLEDNQRLLEQLSGQSRDAIDARGDRFLRGTLKGKPNSWARMNWIDGQFSGAFFDGNTLFLVDDPAGFALPAGRSADADSSLLLRYEDLQMDQLFDHGGEETGLPPVQPADDYQSFVADLRAIVQTEGLTLFSMPVTIVADTFFEDDLGAAAESTAIGRVNFVDGIFSNQLGVGVLLWHYEQLSDNGPLTSTDSSALLGQEFRPYMASGDGSTLPFRGLAHLFTGRNLDGNTVGRAYLNTLCSKGWGYGINQNLSSDTTSALVFAHELGHNYSANHVDEGIMRPTIGGSQQFSQESVDVMSAAVSRADCLVDGGLRIFEDGFD